MTKDFLQVPYDDWNKALDEQIVILKTCQQEKKLPSCTSCPEIIECKIRQAYIIAVYESMNKGVGGGFEF